MNEIVKNVADRKIINITGKRQITIPLKFYEKLQLGKEVECVLTDDSLVIRPLTGQDDNFSVEILKDLISQGYSGTELVEKFAEMRKQIRKAVGTLIAEADEIAAGKIESETTADIFGEV
ncbi:MAG: AbrB/MazE/SpoVT family DNA-binding domain-containing protein [Fusobacteriaceae bacterium]|jgi:bifunctional DNA-binding transcriptional regulator/antitoxin component of YhaV-PrlF toxin-antitoxin module|nr:AbrB/MazE/SpoVT family DNA-binding domain-containing protein [Fusobacteriaceae bacterium]